MKAKNTEYFFEIDLQWFAKDGPGGEKTEPATAKKLKDAREEGKVAKSKELTAAFDLITLFLVLKILLATAKPLTFLKKSSQHFTISCLASILIIVC